MKFNFIDEEDLDWVTDVLRLSPKSRAGVLGDHEDPPLRASQMSGSFKKSMQSTSREGLSIAPTPSLSISQD